MSNETITIDIDALKRDIENECLGAFFGGGFGGALIESFDMDRVEPEKLIKMAQRNGINLQEYQV